MLAPGGRADRVARRGALRSSGGSRVPRFPRQACTWPVCGWSKPLIYQHADHLPDVKRVAARRFPIRRASSSWSFPSPARLIDQVSAVTLVERGERHGRRSRSLRSQKSGRLSSNSGRARQRRRLGPRGCTREVLHQVEERRLSPVDVVEGDYQGKLGRERFEQLADGPESFFARRHALRQPERDREQLHDPSRVVVWG